ncbi:hypothetical protein, variant [Puccinia graminis f. sp. tritici CRL 75-36-700-3]|uniref:superoxide dismutase n=2 Tax=Puccinia graminis f. sp. tritici TaxID=56615 RepID=E3K539_PUCGT|nr:uncharacterized protein PGTG_05675 [Puccinia graminis f. sp. tritici CRL 75-36-700-3]XP_003890229.1 hypothetical protein, variant [Puccinia graminis f. sp. tritici CRL 75-36-700-3]EFP79354.1 hypothetical protein PGTG_05675 [Puccinia graminis f. sp. tritici CRL 75-36-700-3]EHS62683.1 hypothetical protein, variant [Puccinia graminis f. sp. tritici CRL 75-36-700-3]
MLSPFLITLALFINVNLFGLTSASTPGTNGPAPSAGAPQGLSTSALSASANLTGHFNVSGQIHFALQPESNAVAVSISINGLNALNSTAAYAYHIHTNPISSDGNCASALGHLDPLNVTDGLVCNPQISQYCQEGDLSSRHGKFNGSESTLNLAYIDDYLRFWPQPFSILGRSVVVHLPNSTRIACGNITSTVDGTANPDGAPTFNKSNYTTQYPSQAPPAPPAKFEPFNGTTPNPAITLPSALPTVQMLPNVMLGTNATTQTVNGKTEQVILPAAVNATTPFTYTPGAVLPSQNDTSISNSTAGGNNGATDPKKGASSGVQRLAPPLVFTFFSGLCLLIYL